MKVQAYVAAQTQASIHTRSCMIWSVSYRNAPLQAYAAMEMRSELFCDFKQRRMLIPYGRFGTIYRSILQGSNSPRSVPGILFGMLDT